MNYLEINRSANPCCVSLPTECIKPRCIEVALIIITLTGAALVGAACFSYLPPLAGYVGGGFSLCSLIGLAVGHCCFEKPIHYAVPQTPETSDSYFEIVQPARVTSSALVIPNEVYWQIFQRLEGKELAAASLVCRQWRQVVSDDRLWERLCHQARMCPPEDTFAAPHSYKNLYVESQIWKKRVERGIPPERPITLPVQTGYDLQTICKIEDYFFIHFRNRGGQDEFEIWNVSLSHRLCKTALVDSNAFLSDVRFKKIGDVGYLFGWSRKYVPLGFFPFDIHVLRLDLKTRQPLPYMCFEQKHRAHSHFKPPFDITQNEAFIGLEDGTIVIWDLTSREPSHGGTIVFDDKSHRRSRSEDFLQASYKAEIIAGFSYSHKLPPLEIIYKEEDEFKYSMLQQLSPYYHVMLQNRIRLHGHTQAIINLRIVDHALFSSSRDGTIKQWDLTTHQCVRTLEMGHESGVSLFNIAGRYLFGLDEKTNHSTFSQWDLSTGLRLTHQRFEKEYKIFHVIGNLIFFASEKNSTQAIDIYDLATQTCLQSLTLPQSHYSPDLNEYAFQIVNYSLYVVHKDRFHIWDF